MQAKPVKKVRCPQCGGESEWSPANKYRPFCSERCKLIDLGAWASESYRVPVQEADGGLEDPSAPPSNEP
ncbi:DNA gyrase inhibitor YacG [Propionivibrio limicola]|uniref:DNA gyrase inhibitor YacG n=1 Tax=Propionivibrio limicola TaxID=167645 RepID=UPI0012929BAE|nr:DNA gyrase inhibitor YacG [Propionivibrio limicola]